MPYPWLLPAFDLPYFVPVHSAVVELLLVVPRHSPHSAAAAVAPLPYHPTELEIVSPLASHSTHTFVPYSYPTAWVDPPLHRMDLYIHY